MKTVDSDNGNFIEYRAMLRGAVVIVTTTLILTIIFFKKWLSSGSLVYAFLSLCTCIIFMIFFWPTILMQRVRLENEYISVLYTILPNYTFPISDSIYKIILTPDGKKFMSYIFQNGPLGARISPVAYTNGEELDAYLRYIIKRDNIRFVHSKKDRRVLRRKRT
ncbi:hypothetical protein QUF80_20780 [Desulfococcaceae bacterium HSG8]|nr:hypothetical protein [Desulfococcaceae bacterium HSG8]